MHLSRSGAPVLALDDTVMQTQDHLISPAASGEWTLRQIQATFSGPLPQSMLETRNQGKVTILYIA